MILTTDINKLKHKLLSSLNSSYVDYDNKVRERLASKYFGIVAELSCSGHEYFGAVQEILDHCKELDSSKPLCGIGYYGC